MIQRPRVDLRELGGASELRHPWEVARARFFARLVREESGGGRPLRVLDVGAGDGYLAGELLATLPAGSRCACVDPLYTDMHLQELTRRAAAGLDFARALSDHERFDVLLLLDVLEHVDDDGALLERYAARVPAGGLVVASVPAHMALYSVHDVRLGHKRRYRPSELPELLRAHGLQVERWGGLFHSLLAVRALQTVLERCSGQRPHPRDVDPSASAPESALNRFGGGVGGAWLAALVTGSLRLDNALSRASAGRGLALPGLSVWASARKV